MWAAATRACVPSAPAAKLPATRQGGECASGHHAVQEALSKRWNIRPIVEQQQLQPPARASNLARSCDGFSDCHESYTRIAGAARVGVGVEVNNHLVEIMACMVR